MKTYKTQHSAYCASAKAQREGLFDYHKIESVDGISSPDFSGWVVKMYSTNGTFLGYL